MSKIKTVEPGPNEIKEAVNVAVEKAAVMCKSILTSTLVFYWEIGALLSQLDKSYGNNAIEDFGKQLSVKIGRQDEFDKSTLYRALKFHRTYSETERDKIIEANLSWTQVQKALPSRPDVVIEAVGRVIDGEVEPTKFAEAVRHMEETDGNPGAAKKAQEADGSTVHESAEDQLGSVHVMRKRLGQMSAALTKAIEDIGDAMIIADNYTHLKEAEDAKEVRSALAEYFGTLDTFRVTAGPLFERLKDLNVGRTKS